MSTIALITEVSRTGSKAFDSGFLTHKQKTYTMMPSGLTPNVDMITNLPVNRFDVLYGCWNDFGKDPDIYASAAAYDVCGNELPDCFAVRFNWQNPNAGRKFALFCARMCENLRDPNILDESKLCFPRMGCPTILESELWSLKRTNSILEDTTAEKIIKKVVFENTSSTPPSIQERITDLVSRHLRRVDVPRHEVLSEYRPMYVAYNGQHVYNFIPGLTGVSARFLWLAHNSEMDLLCCWPEPNGRLRVFGAGVDLLMDHVPELVDGQYIVRFAEYELFPAVTDPVVIFMKENIKKNFVIDADIEE